MRLNLTEMLPQDNQSQSLYIGLDDTDSTRGGCTTYVAALLIQELLKLGANVLDYPSLVRLNPNVPWKTRGNGALCLKINCSKDSESEVKRLVIRLVEAKSDMLRDGTDPGIVFLKAETMPGEIRTFTKKAVTSIVTLEEALNLIGKFGGEAYGYNTKRGIIGALAAIGETFADDHTFELIAYRKPENCGSKRRVDESSIFQMDQQTQPYTFNNVDWEKKRIIITPRGPDPILFGVRGETPDIVRQAFGMIRAFEPVERWVIFRTNQGTDSHIKELTRLIDIQPYTSVCVAGVVSRNPRVIPLRHVIFSIDDGTAEVDCAAYEPTGSLKKIAHELVVGDKVEVSGAAKQVQGMTRLTLNLEKIIVRKLTEEFVVQNPFCPTCGKRLKSMGKNKGLRCDICGSRFLNLAKESVVQERNLKLGLYVTATRSQRHLTKPLRRYGLEKQGLETRFSGDWHYP